jgi:hypothetical protein
VVSKRRRQVKYYSPALSVSNGLHWTAFLTETFWGINYFEQNLVHLAITMAGYKWHYEVWTSTILYTYQTDLQCLCFYCQYFRRKAPRRFIESINDDHTSQPATAKSSCNTRITGSQSNRVFSNHLAYWVSALLGPTSPGFIRVYGLELVYLYGLNTWNTDRLMVGIGRVRND